jgi:TetR/AcrR family transcriptional regulator, transcriptional repressor for nem operon
MPRPKSYNRHDAVLKACNAFRQHGYEALGVRALEELTGLNRFALHTEFGGKKGLFLEALDRYSQEAEAQLLDPLGEGNLDQIENLYRQFVTPSSEPAQAFGCLMVNTVVENAVPGCTAIRERTDRHFALFENAIRSALDHAKSEGQIDAAFQIEAAVAFLLGSTMGVQVLIRRAGNIEAAKPYVEMLIKTIRSWRSKLAP